MTSKFLLSAVSAAVLSLCASATFAQSASAAAPSSPPAAVVSPAAPALATPGAVAAASESGKLAWYGRKFAGRKTASGERFAPEALTMAHKTLPFGTRVRITNPKNNKSVAVRVNDRGPAQADRVGDVSLAAARKLGMLTSGVIDAELTVIGSAPTKRR